jgi:hypothetical protein
MMLRSLLLGAAAALLAACAQSAADAPIADQWRAQPLTVTAVTFPEATVGRLRFRGGLHIMGETREEFGGWSGLEVLDDGRLLAVTDTGEWFEARLVLNEDGDLVGLTDARSALMRGENGEPFASKDEGDAEGLAQLPDGRFAVSFEQTQSIRIYELNRDGPFGTAQPGPRLADTERLPSNSGLEALAAMADGSLLVGAEGGGGPTPLWVASLGASEPAPIRIRYRPETGYSLTSLDRLPDGSFIALERFFAPIIGPRARITRFPAAALDSGGEILPEVEVLASLAAPLPVDNFEGVSAVRMPDGATRIYIVSDDNLSDRQRTLLLAFDLVE